MEMLRLIDYENNTRKIRDLNSAANNKKPDNSLNLTLVQVSQLMVSLIVGKICSSKLIRNLLVAQKTNLQN